MPVIWKDVVGYENYYEVSNEGRVRSLDRGVRSCCNSVAIKRGVILKETRRTDGYLCVNLSKKGKSRVTEIQRIVAMAFLENPDHLPCVNHKDEDRANNNVENLEWCTYKYNNDYGARKEKDRAARINGKMSIPVRQYSKGGVLIGQYPSMAEVKRRHGYDPSKISLVARGKRKTAYGCYWMYEREVV